MPLSIVISLLTFQLLATSLPIGNTDPLRSRYEEVDMLLSNGSQTFGLVTGRVYPNHFCILENSLKERLGYAINERGNACMSLEELESEFGIPLLLDMANVELQMPHDFDFPAKAYNEAVTRVSRGIKDEPTFMWSSPRYKPSVWINTKRFDLILRNSGNFIVRPDIQSAIGGDLLGGTFNVRGLAVNNRTENTYMLHSLDYSWYLNPRLNNTRITSIELGSRVYDVDQRYILHGIKLTNKPLSSREVQFSERLIINAAEGSILEWDHPIGNQGHRVFDESGSITLDTPLKYGLNKLHYHITEPGELTKQREMWIRVPTKLIPKRKLEYQILFGYPNNDKNSQVSYGKVEYGIGNRLSVGVHQTAIVSEGGIKSQFGTDFVLRPTFETEFQGYLNSDFGYSLSATYWNPKLATIELLDNRNNRNNVTPNRFDRRSSLVRISMHRIKFVRTQASYLRTTYGFGSSSVLNSTLMANTHRWNIASIFGYQWWKNNGTISMGLIRASGHISHRVGRNHMISTDINTIIQDQIKLESIKVSSFYNTSSFQLGANLAFHTQVQSISAGLTARIHSEWFNTHLMHEATNQGHISSQFLSTSWMKSGQSQWHAASQTSYRSSGLVLIPFLDLNRNGIKDRDEKVLSGLIGKINEGRVIDSKKSPGKLIFAELQPNRKYQITLSTDLRNDPDYLVTNSRLYVDTPGSGYREIYIPVSKSFEFTGLWKNESNLIIQPGRTTVMLRQIDGDLVVQGTLFGDGTWFINKLGHGKYEVSINDSNNDELIAYPKLLYITKDQIDKVPTITIRTKA